MEQMFTETSKTGDIVTQFPMASQIFKKYKIDFCCGGDRPIGEALEQKQLDKEEVLQQINELYQASKSENKKQINWAEQDYGTLIDHVLNVHHAYLNQALPELAAFVKKVYRVHGQHRPELAEVFSLFNQLKMELEHHLIQEEEMIFPKVKEYEQAPSQTKLEEIVQAIEVLEREHERSGNLLHELRKVTNDYILPEGACNTYRLTYLKLEELESDLFEHIHLENNILFPRLEEENTSSGV